MSLKSTCEIPPIKPGNCDGERPEVDQSLKFLAAFVDICLARGESLPGGLNIALSAAPFDESKVSIELTLSPKEAQRLMRVKRE